MLWFPYSAANIQRKLLGFHTWFLTISAPLRTLAPNHAGDECSRWQLANQMVIRNMIRYVWFTWRRNDDDCDQDDGEGNVMIWHGWSIACQPLMACCDFFLDKLSNSAPFCSHFPIGPKYFCTFSQKVSNSTDLNWCNHVLRVAYYSNQYQAKHF